MQPLYIIEMIDYCIIIPLSVTPYRIMYNIMLRTIYSTSETLTALENLSPRTILAEAKNVDRLRINAFRVLTRR